MGLRLGLLILLSNILVSASAASRAVVDALQMPAWLDRGGRVLPLTPGLEVKSGDRLRTGEGARAYLKLPEGSTIKLCESAQLRHQTAPVPAIFTAALEVATGAFRFTTSALQKLRKRNGSIQVGTATIGIRGTDVWGKSDNGNDLVMLIEGHVEVTPAVGEVVELMEPMTVFTAPKGGAGTPITLATLDVFKARHGKRISGREMVPRAGVDAGRCCSEVSPMSRQRWSFTTKPGKRDMRPGFGRMPNPVRGSTRC